MKIPSTTISRWSINDSGDVYRIDGYVGIGTNEPSGLIGLKDSDTNIDVDTNGNITFTDIITGTKTLSELVTSGGATEDQINALNAEDDALGEAIQTILKDLDGYLTPNEVPGAENMIAVNEAIQTILKDLDGYALKSTEDQRWIDSSQQLQDLRDSVDGYALNSSLSNYALKSTEDQRWIDSSQQLQDLRDSVDGYALNSSLSNYALKSIEDQRWIDSSQQLQDLRDSVDGYALKSTEDQRWIDSSQQLQDIRDAIDGYGTGSGTPTDLTQVEEAIQTILKDLDGYALKSTEDQRWIDSSQQLQDIRDAIDGYSGGSINLVDLNDVDGTDVPAKNDVVIWNGSKFVFAPYNTSFTFSIASFSNSQSSTALIGIGTWKAIGALSFTATYTNGPATGGYVTMSGFSNSWGSSLTLTNVYQGPTVSTEIVDYPSSPGTATFVLHATDGSTSPTSTISQYFYNYRFWSVTTKTSGYSESDIESMTNSELSNSRSKTFTLSPSPGEYIIYSYPTRLGAATFTIGGFEGGFMDAETVSVTNSLGYTENYYIYRSINSGLGSTTVVAS